MLLGEDVIAVAAKAPPAPPHAKDVVVVDPVSDLSDLVAPAPDLLSTTETFTLASALATMCSSTAAEPISYGFSDFLLSFCNGDRKGRNEGMPCIAWKAPSGSWKCWYCLEPATI